MRIASLSVLVALFAAVGSVQADVPPAKPTARSTSPAEPTSSPLSTASTPRPADPKAATAPNATTEPSTQRVWAWVLLGTGAASLTAGITFGVLSVVEHRASRDFRPANDGDFTDEEEAEYDAIISARDNYRIVSGITGGAALAMVVTGSLLFAFDPEEDANEKPSVAVYPVLDEERVTVVVGGTF
jgi:hypothetical protein